MNPYADFLYFGMLLYPIVPTVLLGLLGRISWRWILIVTLAMAFVQYSDSLHVTRQLAVLTIWLVAGYTLLQWAVARTLLALRSYHAASPFYAALTLALLPLVAAKFLPMLAPGTLFGFLGLSYATFRSLDVLFGIQDKLITELPLSQYSAYILFFPTISSGPIDRYRRFATDWQRRRSRAEFVQDLDGCVQHVFRGFLYKFILAYLINQYWLMPAASGAGLVHMVSYMYAYSLYLFFDFAGYSAFAIGISYLFGIHAPENFNLPFRAADIRDFWNRWHISLSTWIRDHIYMRFLLAATKRRWFTNKHVMSYTGFILSMGLIGLWHGTQPHFIIYGLYHAALMIGYDLFSRLNKRHHWWGDSSAWQAAGVLITAQFVCFGFLIFSGHLFA